MSEVSEKKFVWFSKTIVIAVLFEGITLLEANMEVIQQLFGVSWFHIASILLPLFMFYLRLVTHTGVTSKRNKKETSEEE